MGAFDEPSEKKGVFDLAEKTAELVQLQEPTIEIQAGSGMKVVMRSVVREEDETWVMNRFVNLMINRRQKLSYEAQIKLVDKLWLELMIVSWTLPIALEPNRAKAIEKLTQRDRDYIYSAFMATQPQKKTQQRRELGEKAASPALLQAVQKRRKPPAS